MDLHHVWVMFPDGGSWETFVEASDGQIEKIAERLAFFQSHGAVTDWRTSRVVRQHDFDSLKRTLDEKVQPESSPRSKKGKGKDSDWPYDWSKPEL